MTATVSARMDRPGLAWALFECGRIPYVIMVSVVFMPYFARSVVGNAVAGQTEVASFAKIAGFAAACSAPLLGALLDQLGPRKPWIAAFMAVLVCVVGGLWFALPGGAGLPIAVISAMLVLGKLFYTYTEMMHNSLLAVAAQQTHKARISGLSITLGSLTGFAFLIGVLVLLTLPAQGGVDFVPARPVLGLDPARFEHLRIVPVLSAALLVLSSLPLLLKARDYPATGRSAAQALRGALDFLGNLARHLRSRPQAARFLLARMIYADGIAAISLFTGVLAAGVMGWKASELLILGIGQLAATAVGATLLARLDLRIGSKRTLQLMLACMALLLLVIVGTSPARLAFVPIWAEPPALWDGPVFRTLPDGIFLGLLLAMTGFTAGTTASSRALLAALSPASEAGAYFGLYAMAGTITAWLAPLAIEIATRLTGSQQAGILPVVAFLLTGLALLGLVREPQPTG